MFAYAGTTYVVSGDHLYSVATSGGNFNGLTSVQTLAADVVSCCLFGDELYFAYGSAANAGKYNLATSTYTAGTLAYTVRLIGVSGALLFAVKQDETTLLHNISSGSTLGYDTNIRQVAHMDGGLWVSTREHALEEHHVGRGLDASDWRPTDDLSWAVQHFGRLWTWISGEIMYYDTTDDSFHGTGIRGQGTRGACSVGSWLVVIVEHEISGDAEIWGYDGRGWWMLDDGTIDARNPVSIVGSCDDADLLTGRGTTTTHAATWQFLTRSTGVAYGSSFELITALMDAGERDLDKVWRRAGVELATPDDRATADSVTVALSYSVDGGANWVSIDSQNLTNASSRLVSVGGAISAKPTSRFIQLKVAVSSISAWCPVIVGLWAEHETMDLPTRRRRWKFTVQLTDQVVIRDGSIDDTGARDLAIGLWDSWDNGSIVTFKDVDYDETVTSYSVRIAGIREVITKAADIAMASSDVELTLVEV